MDVSYYKERYEPIDGKWYIKELLGEGSYGKVFRIEREDMSGIYSAALKIITIPQSEKEVDNVRASLQDENSVSQYFKNMTKKLVEEFKLMSQLKGNTNIVSYEDHEIVQHAEGVGYDVLIRMELLEPLNKHLEGLSEQDVVRIGIDICKALEVCQKYNIVHRDIKPENIFISPAGDYKLGDFGVAKTMKNEMTVMTTTGTYIYMAPELKKGEKCGTNVDVYSLGMVMYKLLNYNREPFLPLPPEMFTFEQREQALVNRLKGMDLPKPANASDRLAEIILKACAYNPQMRYESPLQMRMELENLVIDGKSSAIEDNGFLPEDNFIPTLYASPFALGNDKLDDKDRTTGLFDEPYIPQKEEKKDDSRSSVDFDETVSLFGKSESHNETLNVFDTEEDRDSINVQNQQQMYLVNFVREGKWPYVVDVFVDGVLTKKKVKDGTYSLKVNRGSHKVTIQISDIDNLAIIGSQKNRDMYKEMWSIDITVNSSSTITYGKDGWKNALKLISLKSDATSSITNDVETGEYAVRFKRKEQLYNKAAYGSPEGYGIDIYEDGDLICSDIKDDYILNLSAGKHILSLNITVPKTALSKLLGFDTKMFNKKVNLSVNGDAEIEYGFDRIKGRLKIFSTLGAIQVEK